MAMAMAPASLSLASPPFPSRRSLLFEGAPLQARAQVAALQGPSPARALGRQGALRSLLVRPRVQVQRNPFSGGGRSFSSVPLSSSSSCKGWTRVSSSSSSSSRFPAERPSLPVKVPHVDTSTSPAASSFTLSPLVSALLLTVSILPLFGLLSPPASATVAADSIAALSFGQKVATALRSSGISDEVIIFLMAMLPVIELRGSVPVAYWMKLNPFNASVLAVLGNMVPVPFILLFLGPISSYIIRSNETLGRVVTWLLETTRKKAGPIAEFRWLGLMLFVAVPLPGTGAWSGAIAAFLLGLPFWSSLSANFVGVLLAGLIMNILCQLGLRSALLFGLALFLASTFVWSFLRWLSGRLSLTSGGRVGQDVDGLS